MSTYLRVQDGIAVEEWSEPDGFTLNQCFTTDVAELFQPKGSASVGWTWDGVRFSPPVAANLTADDLIAYAAAKRFSVETGGITVENSKVSTDRASQSLITGAYNYVQANPLATVNFKSAGGFVELAATQMTAIANAVAAHVQSCFAVEAQLSKQIADNTTTTIAAIDAAAWPANS